MNRYRFKTREEFKLIDRWNDEYECPVDWAEGQEMNHYLGEEILNSDCIALCESNDAFNMDSWVFEHFDYVLIEEETNKKLVSFPSTGACSIKDCDDMDGFRKYLIANNKTCNHLAGNPKYIAWNDNSYWWCVESTSKTIYEWNDLKQFIYINKESLVGRWVKFVKNISPICPVGSYDIVTEDADDTYIYLEKYRTCARMRFTDGEIELMPVGWSPKSVELPLTDNIPEYVECIKAQPEYNNYGELGKIYKVDNWNHSITDCMLVGTTSGCTSKSRFKPSTKEAYDSQNKLSEALTFKIGDWVVVKQDTGEKGKIGQILSKDPNSDLYWRISNMIYPYKDDQMRHALIHEIYEQKTLVKSFPIKWCLKITDENKQVLDAWRKQQPGYLQTIHVFKQWLISDANDGTYTNWYSGGSPSGYTEIAYEEFITNVNPCVWVDTTTKGLEAVVTTHADMIINKIPEITKKPLIENVQSISVNLRTKKQINKLKF